MALHLCCSEGLLPRMHRDLAELQFQLHASVARCRQRRQQQHGPWARAMAATSNLKAPPGRGIFDIAPSSRLSSSRASASQHSESSQATPAARARHCCGLRSCQELFQLSECRCGSLTRGLGARCSHWTPSGLALRGPRQRFMGFHGSPKRFTTGSSSPPRACGVCSPAPAGTAAAAAHSLAPPTLGSGTHVCPLQTGAPP